MWSLVEQVILGNRWVRILGVAFAMHIIAFIDRNNIAMAIPTMRTTLGLSAASIGFASGSLYFTYLIMQVPAGRLAETWSAKKVILISALLWGAVSLSTAFVTTGTELIVNRMLMGLVEGGETITLIVLVRNWFSRSERARALMVILVSVPLSSVISNVVSGYILKSYSWEWMFVIEAVPALLWAGVWQFAIADHPREAAWLARGVKASLEARLREEVLAVPAMPGHWTRVMWQPVVVLLALSNFFFLTGNLGVVLWLPSVLQETGLPIERVGVLSSLTYVAGAVTMVLCSFSSDRFGDRKWHIFGLCAAAAAFLLVASGLETSAVAWIDRSVSPSSTDCFMGALPCFGRSRPKSCPRA